VKKIKDSQIEVIINALCSNMFSDSERLRDISSVGLKTVIAELPRTTPAVATNASRNITSRMVEAIAKPVSTCSMHAVFDLENVIMMVWNLQDLNQYVLLETLDILGDLIRRYGGTSK
jgi:cullin-associated NEDD8-dissociated protein 1